MTTVRVTVEGSGEEFVQDDGDTLLRAALRAGVGVPYECNSGGCGSCRIQVVDGDVVDLWPEAPGRTPRDHRQGKLLACQACARSDATIRVRISPEYVGPVAPRRRAARLVAVDDLTHDMRRFVFRADAPAEFLPGQFLSVFLPGLPAPRNYSMANLANSDGDWELIVRRVPGGVATGRLFDLAEGDEVELDGPYGLATLRTDAPRDIVCVAGGSGLAPMLSIVRGAASAGMLGERRVHFFYGARTPADVCGEAELRRLARADDWLDFRAVVSAPAVDHGQDWDGLTGFVHEAACGLLADRLADDAGAFEWYCAGPAPMTQALLTALVVERSVPVGQVHYDRFC